LIARYRNYKHMYPNMLALETFVEKILKVPGGLRDQAFFLGIVHVIPTDAVYRENPDNPALYHRVQVANPGLYDVMGYGKCGVVRGAD